jgi:hypothetical protein
MFGEVTGHILQEAAKYYVPGQGNTSFLEPFVDEAVQARSVEMVQTIANIRARLGNVKVPVLPLDNVHVAYAQPAIYRAACTKFLSEQYAPYLKQFLGAMIQRYRYLRYAEAVKKPSASQRQYSAQMANAARNMLCMMYPPGVTKRIIRKADIPLMTEASLVYGIVIGLLLNVFEHMVHRALPKMTEAAEDVMSLNIDLPYMGGNRLLHSIILNSVGFHAGLSNIHMNALTICNGQPFFYDNELHNKAQTTHDIEDNKVIQCDWPAIVQQPHLFLPRYADATLVIILFHRPLAKGSQWADLVANAELFVTHKTANGRLMHLQSLPEEQQTDMAEFVTRRLFGPKQPEWNLVFTANGRTREYVEAVMHGQGWVYCASPFAIVHNVSSLDVATVTRRSDIYKQTINGLRELVKQYRDMPAVKRADYVLSPAPTGGGARKTRRGRKAKAKGRNKKSRRS